MVPTPTPTYQSPTRHGCSDFYRSSAPNVFVGGSNITLYHMTVTSMREGATADSKTPSKTLVVTRPAQFFAADVQTTMIPHCVCC
jgi:hypothetical protein